MSGGLNGLTDDRGRYHSSALTIMKSTPTGSSELSAGVYECFLFIWPYHAQTVEMAVRPLNFAD